MNTWPSKSVVKQNKIICVKCNKNFEIKDNDFKAIEILKKQLDDFLFLSDEEFAAKKKIEESIQKLFQMYDEFILNKTRIDLDVHEHFQKIRFQLDEHREKLMVKIDDIYM